MLVSSPFSFLFYDSVSCGIPDFRSENGVYDLASRLDLGLTCPEDLFDLEFFTDDPEPFFKFAKVRCIKMKAALTLIYYITSSCTSSRFWGWGLEGLVGGRGSR